MEVSPKLNDFRRTVMQRLTRNIGLSNIDSNFAINNPSQIRKILICRPNHRLGNLLLVTPLLEELAEVFPESRVDLFVKGTAGQEIFRNFKNVGNIIALPRHPFKSPVSYAAGWIRLKLYQYDLVINIDKKSASGRLSTKWANAKYRFLGDEEPEPAAEKHIAKKPVRVLRKFLQKIGIGNTRAEIPQLNLKLTWVEMTRGKKKLHELTGNDRKTISVFTNASGGKCYSELWWTNFYYKLKFRYRNYNIIEILPAENVSKLNFRVPSFYSRDIREIAAVIANTTVFIGADSGIMHLASAAGAPTLGLFSVSDQAKYEPYNPKSAAVNTNKKKYKHCFKALDKILERKKRGHPALLPAVPSAALN